MALSDVMWDLGKLNEEIKEKDLYHIDAGNDVVRWEAENKEKGRGDSEDTENEKDNTNVSEEDKIADDIIS